MYTEVKAVLGTTAKKQTGFRHQKPEQTGASHWANPSAVIVSRLRVLEACEKENPFQF